MPNDTTCPNCTKEFKAPPPNYCPDCGINLHDAIQDTCGICERPVSLCECIPPNPPAGPSLPGKNPS